MKKTRNIYITFTILLICISFLCKDFLIIHAQIAPEELLAVPEESSQSAEVSESEDETPTLTLTPAPTLSLEDEIERNGFVEGVMSELNTLNTEDVTIDESARHTCVMDEFSKPVQRGNSQFFQFQLISPEAISIVSNALTVGDLPDGVTGTIFPAASKVGDSYKVQLEVEEFAQRGSFNIIIFYQQKDNDELVTTSTCQFNMIIE